MKKSNFNFKDIKSILSRDEMRQIKGGSGDPVDPTCGYSCQGNSDCKGSLCTYCATTSSGINWCSVQP